jgi:predicted alpha-1,2-mannosidase
VDVELTATERVGFHKYTFPADVADARVVIDLENGNCWDSPVEGYIVQTGPRTIAGYRYSRGWANDQKLYFTAEFSHPVSEFRVFDKNERREGTELTARSVYGEALFDTADGEPVYVKVALSPVSIKNAWLNMEAEIPDWDFEATVNRAEEAWNAQLGKIAIETADESVKRIFYTGLYHSMTVPSLFCDANGDYRGADGQAHSSDGFVNYTTFSLWDTYRAAHPLMTIIHPDRVPDMVNTMLHIYEQQGKLPVWHLMGCETDCMVGNPGIPVVADAMLKGFDGFDSELAFEAMKNSAMLDERGMGLLKEYGYIPCDLYGESVATGMEYALADWCVAQVADRMGKEEDYNYFTERSKSYQHYFDSTTRFVRGKMADGTFRAPFDPFSSTHRSDDYTEGNAWQYTWLVPHDIEGLAALMGGMEPFSAKLDSLFVAEGHLGDEASPDISGLIGQYAHGNEPSHHITYIYSMIGEQWKTAELVRRVLRDLYHDSPDGLSGNEDAGQMSSWYILSSLGFYQIEPAGGRYFFGSPLIDRAELKVRDGIFTITANNNSPENIYIQSITLNGKPHTKAWLDFADIAAGGELVFEMGSRPNKTQK